MRAGAAVGAATVALAAHGAAAAATPIGAPRELRVSRPADERSHPTAHTELWELLAVDPRSRRTLAVRLRRAPGFEGVDVAGGAVPPDGGRLAQTFQRAAGPLVRFSGPGGTTTITRRRGRFTLRLESPEITGRLELRGVRPGPYARGWSLGPALRHTSPAPVATGMSLNVPVATSTLSGELRAGGRTTRLRGWRASLEHVWGAFDLRERTWSYWDAFTVHTPRGGAWLAFGLNRTETVVGPGARDGQFLGVLARVTARGVRVCRPVVHRRDWTYGFREMPYAHRMHARCRGLRVTLLDGADQALPGEAHEDYFQRVHPARASGGGAGTGRHRGHEWG